MAKIRSAFNLCSASPKTNSTSLFMVASLTSSSSTTRSLPTQAPTMLTNGPKFWHKTAKISTFKLRCVKSTTQNGSSRTHTRRFRSTARLGTWTTAPTSTSMSRLWKLESGTMVRECRHLSGTGKTLISSGTSTARITSPWQKNQSKWLSLRATTLLWSLPHPQLLAS